MTKLRLWEVICGRLGHWNGSCSVWFWFQWTMERIQFNFMFLSPADADHRSRSMSGGLPSRGCAHVVWQKLGVYQRPRQHCVRDPGSCAALRHHSGHDTGTHSLHIWSCWLCSLCLFNVFSLLVSNLVNRCISHPSLCQILLGQDPEPQVGSGHIL